MKVLVERGEAWGKLEAPPSKSLAHRALICGALAEGKSEIRFLPNSEDVEATREALGNLGISLTKNRSDSWLVEGGELLEPSSEIFCRESGTTMRFLASLCSLIDGKSVLTAGPSLSKRPIGPLIDALNALGAKCSCNSGFPPAMIQGVMRGGYAQVLGNLSSQFVSALLLASPLADETTMIEVRGDLVSKPYVIITIEVQKAFGVDIEADGGLRRFIIDPQRYKASTFEVEGDWSSAAFILALGILSGRTEVIGLRPDSSQADREIVEFLRRMGGSISLHGVSVVAQESDLNAIRADVSNCPDLFPVLAALCATAKGRSELYGIGRLRFKESDRVAAMAEGLERMGAKVEVIGDSFFIEGSRLHPAEIDPKGDHRIAMAFAVLGAKVRGVAIENAECVSKSWPGFWDCLANLGVQLREGA